MSKERKPLNPSWSIPIGLAVAFLFVCIGMIEVGMIDKLWPDPTPTNVTTVIGVKPIPMDSNGSQIDKYTEFNSISQFIHHQPNMTEANMQFFWERNLIEANRSEDLNTALCNPTCDSLTGRYSCDAGNLASFILTDLNYQKADGYIYSVLIFFGIVILLVATRPRNPK